MDVLSFVAALVDALAWPAVLVVLLVIGRAQIRELVRALLKLRYKSFELEFGRRVQELEEQLDPVSPVADVKGRFEATLPPLGSTLQGHVYSAEESLIARLATISPRAAVYEAWREVEHALVDLAQRYGMDSRRSPGRLVGALDSRGVLSGNTVLVLNELRTLRNEAVHQREVSLSTQEALEYAAVAQRIERQLRGLLGSENEP